VNRALCRWYVYVLEQKVEISFSVHFKILTLFVRY
jgi:hypothetical protein